MDLLGKLVAWLRQRWAAVNKPATAAGRREALLVAVELGTILLWTVFLARPFLNLDPNQIPYGREFSWAIDTHFAWDWVWKCGGCMFWNGNFEGGHPAFGDPLSSLFHPLVVFSTLIWGVINGAKFALAGALLLAGLSQWLLGYVLGIGRVPRVWTALMAVIGGHLTSRLDQGVFGVVISMASFSLALALLMLLLKKNSPRTTVLFGWGLAALAVGGQGYVQFGTILTFLAALVAVIIAYGRKESSDFLFSFFQAVFLAILLAGPFLIPFIHFLPNFVKDFDLSFREAQPLGFVPLNLVINDNDFYLTEALGKAAFPSHYVLYIGWVPVLLAFVPFIGAISDTRRSQLLIFSAMVFTAFWAGSGELLRLLIRLNPMDWLDQIIAGTRYAAFISGLAVPPLLGLAGLGLDRILRVDFPRIGFNLGSKKGDSMGFSFPLTWVALVFLALALRSAYQMNARWFRTIELGPFVSNVLQALDTPDSQWVNTPYGVQFWYAPAFESGLKIAEDVPSTWHWRERSVPQAVLEASESPPRPGMSYLMSVDGYEIHAADSIVSYAAVQMQNGELQACSANSTWGNIDVRCSLAEAGLLTVQENNWTGWNVRVNDRDVPIKDGAWLQVDLPAGESSIEFRFRPWDVYLGMLLFVAGILVSARLWFRETRESRKDI